MSIDERRIYLSNSMHVATPEKKDVLVGVSLLPQAGEIFDARRLEVQNGIFFFPGPTEESLTLRAQTPAGALTYDFSRFEAYSPLVDNGKTPVALSATIPRQLLEYLMLDPMIVAHKKELAKHIDPTLHRVSNVNLKTQVKNLRRILGDTPPDNKSFRIIHTVHCVGYTLNPVHVYAPNPNLT